MTKLGSALVVKIAFLITPLFTRPYIEVSNVSSLLNTENIIPAVIIFNEEPGINKLSILKETKGMFDCWSLYPTTQEFAGNDELNWLLSWFIDSFTSKAWPKFDIDKFDSGGKTFIEDFFLESEKYAKELPYANSIIELNRNAAIIEILEFFKWIVILSANINVTVATVLVYELIN